MGKTLFYRIGAALSAAALCVMLTIVPQQAGAVAVSETVHQSYVIAYEPLFGTHIPFLGWLQITVKNGIIGGTYRSLSITSDDPFVNHINTVTGATNGSEIHFDIGSGASRLSFNGRKSANWISGSATWRGQLYRLQGEIGTPRGMK